MSSWPQSSGLVATSTGPMEAFTVVRDVPNRQTERTRVLASSKSEELPDSTCQQAARLHAFPALVKGDSAATRALRADSCEMAWRQLSTAIQAELGRCDAQAFAAVTSFVSAEHQRARVSQKEWPSRIVPTAVTVAGGSNLADHTHTFQGLRDALHEQGCHTALLHARDFSEAAGESRTMAAVLAQLAPNMSHSTDSHGLAAWYRQQLASSASQPTPEKAPQVRAPAEALASPLDRMGLRSPVQGSRAARRLSLASEASSLASTMRKVKLTSPGSTGQSLEAIAEDQESGISSASPNSRSKRARDAEEASDGGRRLRSRAQPAGMQKRNMGVEQASGSHLHPQQRPVVMIVPAVEGLPPRSLQDFILTLSELQREVPITLVLGVTTTASALDQLLPVAACDCLRRRPFPLMQASERLDAVVAHVLLKIQPPVFFGHRVLKTLHQRCMQHDATIPSLMKALHVACIAHFQAQPLSFLAAPEDAGASWAALPEPLLQHGLQDLPMASEDLAGSAESLPPQPRGRGRPRKASKGSTPASKALKGQQGSAAASCQGSARLQGALAAVRRAWTRFAAALLWVHAIASMGSCRDGLRHSIFELLVDASSPQFMATSGQRLLAKLARILQGLDCGGLQEAILKLQAAADCVPGAPEAMEAPLHALQGLAEEVTSAAASQARQVAPSDQNIEHEAEAPGTSLPPRTGAAGKPKGQKARTQALEASLQAAAAATQASPDPRSASVRQAASKLAALFQACMEQNLAVPPSQLPGASILCCNAEAADLACLSMAPRHAIHTALSRPDTYLGGGVPQGRHPDQEDACIAYDIFLEYGESFSLLDWFQQFCAVFNQPQGAEEAAADQGPGKAKKPLVKQRKRGSRKVLVEAADHASGQADHDHDACLQPDERPAAAQPSGQTRSRRATGQTIAAGKREGAAAGAAHAAIKDPPQTDEKSTSAVPLQELAVRFEAATQALQLLGLVRPATRRGNGFAQKLVFMPGSQSSSKGTETEDLG